VESITDALNFLIDVTQFFCPAAEGSLELLLLLFLLLNVLLHAELLLAALL